MYILYLKINNGYICYMVLVLLFSRRLCHSEKIKLPARGSFISLSKELNRLTQRRLHIIHIRHRLHRGPLLVSQHMSIGIQRKSNRIMPQQNRKSFRIHTLFHSMGSKGMPQCMKVVVRQIGRRQHLLIIFTHKARLDIEAVLLRGSIPNSV